MKESKGFQKYLPYLLAIVFFLIITFLYFSPVLSCKSLSMHDEVMARGNSQESIEFYNKTGEYAWWTNNVFGGMPTNMIHGNYDYSIGSKLGTALYAALPLPVNVIFLLMLGFFIFMISLRKNIWIAIIASVAYAFGTYNLLYTEAGHISKILALAYAPGIIGGIALIFRQKYALGAFVTALFVTLQIQANHLQITYYFIFVIGAYFISKAITLIKSGETQHLIRSTLVIALACTIGIGMHGMRLWNNIVYASESTRGKSELTQSTVGNTGLTKDYVFGWSYGIDETFNLLVPDLMGGGSVGSLDNKSETYKALTSVGVDGNMASQFVQQLPLYFGNQSITSGPAYSGVLVIFLFILGLFITKNRFKWAILGLVVFFIALAWGSNFASFNYFIYDVLPGYNKFRAVTMTLVVVHFLLVWGAANAISELFSEKVNWETLKKPVTYSTAIIIGLMLMGYFMVDFVGPRDSDFKAGLAQSTGQEIANKIAFALQDDRKNMAWNDVIRGSILSLILLGSIWAFTNKKINQRIFGYLLFLLIAFDLITVGKRYFNNNDFTLSSRKENVFVPTAADEQILKDKDPNFRVINLTTSFMSDSRDSYFHKSIGGYHGAKLKKTQELFDKQLINEKGELNMPVLNMLNIKYFITQGPTAQRNFEALGNSWFIDTLKVVDNADQEMAFLGNFSPKTSAVTQKNQNLSPEIFKADSTNTITLTSYAPNKLVYASNSTGKQFAVFSEIYYRGNKDWKSYINGQEVPHQKVNYLLRGMEIPAGKNEIVFEYKPESVQKGKYIDLISSIGLILLAVGAVYSNYKKS